MSKKGSLIVISGFSGVGKGTVMKSLISRHPGYALSVSATTRLPREGEQDGIEYFFMNEETFAGMIRNNELIEYARYCDHFYGTPRKFVENRLLEGKNVILEIEIQGARKIKSQYPDSVLIFIMPPSADELMSRLSKRGTEAADVILERMERAVEEAKGIEDYDYIFVNDRVETCADQIHSLIESLQYRTDNNTELISEIRSQLLSYAKGE